MGRGARWLLSVVVVAAVAVPASGAASGATRDAPPPPVTVIGDSVLTGVQWYPQASQILEQDLDVHLDVGICRRLIGTSCTFQGVTPPNLLQEVATLGPSLAPTVVVEMGYNDYEATFAQAVETSIRALLAAGATRILWPTLRAAKHPYITMNAILAAAARRHPQLSLPDWNLYARSHPEWFQNDGIHLEPDGGNAFATFLHAAILKALATPTPIVVTPSSLPVAHVGRRYSVVLAASGGTAPYRFSGAPLPKGLVLATDGRLTGRPVRAGRSRLAVVVRDARGRTARLAETVVVTR